MTPFIVLEGVAAPLPQADIDTDVIIPARFLLLLDKTGLGAHAFHERRFARDGTPTDFMLNRAPWDRARILIAGANFGCGSSRENAVWALADFGIRCVIAPSFGDIFFANCFRNGVLPIVLGGEAHAALMAAAEAGESLSVDLTAQRIEAQGRAVAFDADPHRRDMLLRGLDEIGLVLEGDLDAICAHEAADRARRPWLHRPPPAGLFPGR